MIRPFESQIKIDHGLMNEEEKSQMSARMGKEKPVRGRKKERLSLLLVAPGDHSKPPVKIIR